MDHKDKDNEKLFGIKYDDFLRLFYIGIFIVFYYFTHSFIKEFEILEFYININILGLLIYAVNKISAKISYVALYEQESNALTEQEQQRNSLLLIKIKCLFNISFLKFNLCVFFFIMTLFIEDKTNFLSLISAFIHESGHLIASLYHNAVVVDFVVDVPTSYVRVLTHSVSGNAVIAIALSGSIFVIFISLIALLAVCFVKKIKFEIFAVILMNLFIFIESEKTYWIHCIATKSGDFGFITKFIPEIPGSFILSNFEPLFIQCYLVIIIAVVVRILLGAKYFLKKLHPPIDDFGTIAIKKRENAIR